MADKHETDTGHIRDDKPGESDREKSGTQPAHEPVKKAGKMEEFPGINWTYNTNPDIQLCILLYDERVNTWHQMVALRADIDNCPEKALAIADRAYVLETGKIALEGKADVLMNDDTIKKAYLGE